MLNKTFTITTDHLKLMKRVDVHDVTGIPYISTHRPFGNSDHLRDVAEILNWKLNGEMTRKMEKEAAKICRETVDALQICLQLGEFKTGTFVSDGYRKWFKVKQIAKLIKSKKI